MKGLCDHRDSAERLQEQMTGRQNAAAETRARFESTYTHCAMRWSPPSVSVKRWFISKSEWSHSVWGTSTLRWSLVTVSQWVCMSSTTARAWPAQSDERKKKRRATIIGLSNRGTQTTCPRHNHSPRKTDSSLERHHNLPIVCDPDGRIHEH